MPTTSAPAAGTRAARSASARRVHRCFSATRGGRPDQDDAQPGVTSLFMAPGRRHDSWFATPAQTGTALLRSPQQEAPRRPRRTIASATLRSSGSGAARAASRFRNGPRASGPSPHHTPAASARRSTPSTPPSARQPPPPAGSFIHAYNQADDRPPTVINSQPAARTQSSSPTTKQPARSQPLSSDLQPLPQPQPEKPYTPRAPTVFALRNGAVAAEPLGSRSALWPSRRASVPLPDSAWSSSLAKGSRSVPECRFFVIAEATNHRSRLPDPLRRRRLAAGHQPLPIRRRAQSDR